MLLYLSGPMTGKPEFNYPEFNRVAAALRRDGFEVINPAETAGGTTRLSRETFLRIDIGYVLAAEGIALLPGWMDSKGAQLEVMVAQSIGLPIYLVFSDGTLTENIDVAFSPYVLGQSDEQVMPIPSGDFSEIPYLDPIEIADQREQLRKLSPPEHNADGLEVGAAHD